MRTTLKSLTAVLIALLMLLDLPLSAVSALAEVIGVSDVITATVITPVSPETATYIVHVGDTVMTSNFGNNTSDIDAPTLTSNPSGIVSLAKAGNSGQDRRRINITGLTVGQTTASFEFVGSNTKNTVNIATYLEATFASTGLTSVVVNTDTASQVEMPTASAIGFTKTGYVLIGWSKSPDLSNPLAIGAVETLTADTTYYAVWAQAHTVTYNNNGGSGTIAAQSVKQGDSLVLSDGAGFTRVGHMLTGWATTSGGSKAYDLGATITPTDNLTLYAVWAQTFTASYNKNYSGGGGGTVNSQPVISGVDFTLDSVGFTRSGYVQVGWSNSSGNNSKDYDLGGTTSIIANKTFYAVWAVERNASYHANGGSGTIAQQKFGNGYPFTLSDGTGFSRNSYTLIGWSNSTGPNNTKDYDLGETTTITIGNNTKTFYAVWSPLPTATFKRLSGNDIVVNTDATGSFAKPSSAEVALAGHTFQYWTTTAPASGNGYRFSATSDHATWPAEFTATTISANTVFYPVYIAEEYTVTFYVKDATGAEVIAAQQIVLYGDPATAPATGDVPEQNLVFMGWDRAFDSVTESFDVHAVYRSASSKHIKFVGYNGAVQDLYKEVGETVQVPARTVPANGYHYYGWNTRQNNSGVTYQPGDTFIVSKDLTVYELAGYLITFNANYNGANPMTATRYTDPDGFIVLPGDDIGFTRPNYLLASWALTSTPPSGETRGMLALGESVQYDAPTTLYAYWNEVDRTFNHIDVRINGELYIENKIDGVVQSREKVTMSILGAQAKYGSNTTSWSTNVQNGVEIRFDRLSNLTINTDITIIADVRYVLGGTTYTERLTLPMSLQDKLAAAAECPNLNNSSGGFDFILRPGRLTQTFSNSVTFYDYALHVVRQETGILDGHAATITAPTADDVLVPPTTTANGVETSYVFSGWEPRGSYGLGDLSNVTQDMIFDAKYTAVIRKLTRTLTVNKRWQGVPDGVTPPPVSFRVYKGLPGGGQIIWETTPHATGELNAANNWTEDLDLPVGNEAGSEEYAYKVEEEVPVGYTRQNASSIVEGDSYTLVNSQNKYTVTYSKGANGNLTGQNGSGNVVFANQVYGAKTPTAPHATPNAGYTFTGWNPEPSEMVTGDATYTAQYQINAHTVTYIIDGNVYDTESSVPYGTQKTVQGAPDPGSVPTGFTFAGWAPPIGLTVTGGNYTMPDNDVTFVANLTRNTYTVTYLVDGEQYGDIDGYFYGDDVTVRPEPENVGFTFSGWAYKSGLAGEVADFKMPANNVEIEGTFTPITYTLMYKYVDVDGNPIPANQLPSDIAPAQDGTETYTLINKATVDALPQLLDWMVFGWYRNAQFTGEIVNPGSEFAETPPSALTTLYAKLIRVKASLDVEKSVTSTTPESGFYSLGDKIDYSVTVTNIGNQTLTNITVSDLLMGDDETIASLAPGEHKTYTYSHIVTEADILSGGGKLINEVEASTFFRGSHVGAIDREETYIDYLNPSLDVVKTITNQPEDENGYVLGEVIEYSVTVTNNGNQTLTDIKVSDKLMGPDETIDSLAPGESKTYDYSHTVTEADILTGGGELTNVFTASTTFNEEPVEDSDEETSDIEDPNPSLDVVKTITNQPEDENGYVLGEVIEYSVTVTNNGNQTLTNILVSDPLMGDDETIASLAPGESKIYDYPHTVTEADILNGGGKLTNVFTASTTFGEEPVSDSDDETTDIEDPNPSLDVVKTITNQPEDENGYVLGEAIEYSVTVTNNGNQTLTDINVSDKLMGPDITIDSLAPGESKTYDYPHTVTEADILNGGGELTNVFTASTTFNEEPVGDSDTETTNIEDLNPSLDVVKTITNQPEDENGYVLGEVIEYSVTVTNNGNQTLTDINVSDKLMGPDTTIDSLAPGESKTYDYSHTVTEADILSGNGELTNVFTASTTFGEEPVEDSDEETTDIEDMIKSLDVLKTVTSATPAGGYGLGHVISYSVTVTNDGNQTLTDILVSDPLMGDDETIASLAPGESKTYTYEHTVTPEDVAAGNVINEATAKTGDDIEDKSTTTTPVPNAIDVTAKVDWFYGPAPSPESPKPTEVQVQLYANGTPYGTPLTFTGAGTSWTYTWPGLLKTDAEGNPIVYSVAQLDVLAAYTTTNTDNLTILNALKYYIVLFSDFDGTVLKTIGVSYGGSTTPPVDPDNRVGYTFDRWTGGVWENVTADQYIVAVYDTIPGPTVITELGIPLAGGTVANVGDTFD